MKSISMPCMMRIVMMKQIAAERRRLCFLSMSSLSKPGPGDIGEEDDDNDGDDDPGDEHYDGG